MCAAAICYVFFALIPLGGDYLRSSATVENEEECGELLAAWTGEWRSMDWGEEKPQVACIKTLSA